MSVTLPTTTPICVINFLNLFCPDSELVKAVATDVIAKTNAPSPVATIAVLNNLKPPVAFPILPVSPVTPEISPPVCLSTIPITPE